MSKFIAKEAKETFKRSMMLADIDDIYIIILKKFIFLTNFFTDKDSEFRIQ
jgi:hypothetical protein